MLKFSAALRILLDGAAYCDVLWIYFRSMRGDLLLFDEHGTRRGSFTAERILAPKGGRIDGQSIVFSNERNAFYEPEPSLALLGDFIALADGDPRKITQFSRKYSSLGLCAHGFPSSHLLGSGPACKNNQTKDELWESLAAWQHYAARASALLRLASEVADGRDGPQKDWRLLRSRSILGRKGAPIPKPGDRDWQRQCIAWEIRVWLRQAGARPTITWLGKTPVFRLTADSLIGIIGVALLSAVLGSGSVVICSACGIPYSPKRKPAAGKNGYCHVCGKNKRAAKRLWARKQRQLRTER